MGHVNHSELSLLEQSLAALPWSNLLENPRLILLQAWLMQSQHRYSEVNTLLARAEQEMDTEMDTAMHGDFNALRAQVAINAGDQDEAERLAMVALMNCRWPATTAVSLPHPYTVKFCTAKAS
ncbi:transcriptional regulator MalT [Klebsiella michiganensis]|nr:transcriptional regulator MalT [Klebsiella michiganensis]